MSVSNIVLFSIIDLLIVCPGYSRTLHNDFAITSSVFKIQTFTDKTNLTIFFLKTQLSIDSASEIIVI